MLSTLFLAALPLSEVAVGPVPDWVEPIPVELPDSVPVDSVRGGVYELLVDTQEHPTGDVARSWFHAARLVHAEEGMSRVAQLQVDFDPSYQELALHFVRVHRDGRVEDRLEASEITTIQREARLEIQIVDGTRTALYFVPDVRVGDVVEYAFSMRGTPPTFAGHFTSSFGLAFDDPVGRIHHRLFWEAGRDELGIRGHGTDRAPTVTREPAGVEYAWDERDVPPLELEPYLPYWFDPYPWVQLSDHTSWGSVARLAGGLFDVPVARGELRELARSFADAGESDLERATAVLRFVQNEIRYLGVELGVGSWQPNDPATVLLRRYGDCKDKSVLVTNMLAELGIDAAPALVNSVRGPALDEWLPTPVAFDHVIVRAEIDGHTFWMDPTTSSEEGSLVAVDASYYGHALVLADDTTALVPVTANSAAASSVDVLHHFRVHPTQDTAELTIETQYRGEDATAIRAYVANTSRETYEDQCRDYYSRQYPALRVAAPLVVESGGEENFLRTVESYEISSFWSSEAHDGPPQATFYPLEMEPFLTLPPELDRTMPLGIAHPKHLRHRTFVDLPERWQVAPIDERVECASFLFERRVRYEAGNRLVLEYEYESRADHVAPESMAIYADRVERAFDTVNYQLTGAPNAVAASLAPVPTSGSENVNWTLVSLVGMTAFLALVASVLVWRWRPVSPVGSDVSPQPIRGWVAFLALGVFASPILLGFSLREFTPVFRNDVWNTMTTPQGAAYMPHMGAVITFELVANTVMFVGALLTIALYVSKRRAFVPTYVVMTAVAIGFVLTDTYLTNEVIGMAVTEDTAASRGMFFSIVWAIYVMRSEQVRETFVRGVRTRPRILSRLPVDDSSERRAA